MSNDGRFIVFAPSAMSSVSGMGSGPVYIYDSKTKQVTTLVEGSSHSSVSISGNGRYIVFSSNSRELVSNDTNGASDVFVMENPYYEVRSSGGSSSGSLASSASSISSDTQIEENKQKEIDPSCMPGYLFSPTTGKPCYTPSTPQTSNTDNQSNSQNTHRILKQGMQGNDVKQLQIYLNTHNYPLATTGTGSLNHETTYFGNLTKQAVIKFQLANNLTPDGIVGPFTRGKMQ